MLFLGLFEDSASFFSLIDELIDPKLFSGYSVQCEQKSAVKEVVSRSKRELRLYTKQM